MHMKYSNLHDVPNDFSRGNCLKVVHGRVLPRKLKSPEILSLDGIKQYPVMFFLLSKLPVSKGNEEGIHSLRAYFDVNSDLSRIMTILFSQLVVGTTFINGNIMLLLTPGFFETLYSKWRDKLNEGNVRTLRLMFQESLNSCTFMLNTTLMVDFFLFTIQGVKSGDLSCIKTVIESDFFLGGTASDLLGSKDLSVRLQTNFSDFVTRISKS
jgi:hypothetical protein